MSTKEQNKETRNATHEQDEAQKDQQEREVQEQDLNAEVLEERIAPATFTEL